MRQAVANRPTATSGVPIAGRTVRNLFQVVDDLVAVRPVNWEDSRDPQQRAAWRAADEALIRFGVRRRGG